jgi:hypothetical protein
MVHRVGDRAVCEPQMAKDFPLSTKVVPNVRLKIEIEGDLLVLELWT